MRVTWVQDIDELKAFVFLQRRNAQIANLVLKVPEGSFYSAGCARGKKEKQVGIYFYDPTGINDLIIEEKWWVIVNKENGKIHTFRKIRKRARDDKRKYYANRRTVIRKACVILYPTKGGE